MLRARPRRILMTADAVGGVWQYAMQLAATLADHGVETVLAVLGPSPSAQQRAEACDIPGLRLALCEGKLEWMPAAESDVARSGEWLLTLQRRYRPDLIHLNGYCHASLNWRKPIVVVAHSCVRSWWRSCRGTELPPEWDGYVARVAQGLHAADMVIAPTRAFLADIAHLYGTPAVCQVIPNGCLAPVREPAEKKPLIMAVGRIWDEAKNLRILDRVAGISSLPIRIAGPIANPVDGTRQQPVSATYLGCLSQSALARRLLEAAIFVHPALYEPFGLCVLEAANAGCALVLSDIPSLRELWHGAAIFVDARSEREIADALNMLARDPEHRASLGRKAWERARSYDARKMAEGYMGAYSRVLSRFMTIRTGSQRSVDLTGDPSWTGAPTGALP